MTPDGNQNVDTVAVVWTVLIFIVFALSYAAVIRFTDRKDGR